MTSGVLLEIRDLEVHFAAHDKPVRAVDGVTYTIDAEKTLGVVGESGCGKTVTALAIMGLIPSPPGRIAGGQILYHREGRTVDLARLPSRGLEMRAIRGNEIAMIFQEPMTSLNPVLTIGFQIMEAIRLHQRMRPREARRQAIDMLRAVGIPLPEDRVDAYPHQMSGGMRQRAMIAMALSCNPVLLIADEPTTALDVTIQAQVLELMNSLRREFRAAIQFITHDLGVIAGMADDVAVMYLGRIVEAAAVREIYHSPKHPYTQGLMKSIPSLTRSKERLVPIEGIVPDPSDAPPGCGFEPRCPERMDLCKKAPPRLVDAAPNHKVSCWLYDLGPHRASDDPRGG
jgi:oligopeptide/dipeptide ABC transporter ATP-binding protein